MFVEQAYEVDFLLAVKKRFGITFKEVSGASGVSVDSAKRILRGKQVPYAYQLRLMEWAVEKIVVESERAEKQGKEEKE